MLKKLICLLWGHKTVHKAVTGSYDTYDRLTGFPIKGHYYEWKKTPYCTRGGKDVEHNQSKESEEMDAKRKAAQIYDQYWSAVSRRPASNKDPLPDIRPLIKQALIEAIEEEREACAAIGDFLAEHTGNDYKREAYIRMTKMIRGRSL